MSTRDQTAIFVTAFQDVTNIVRQPAEEVPRIRGQEDANRITASKDRTMHSKTLSLAVVIAALGAGAASASQPGYYFSGEGGVSLMPDQMLSHAIGAPSYSGPVYGRGPVVGTGGVLRFGNLHERVDTGYNWGVAAGYDFGNGMRVEADALHTVSGIDGVSGVPSSGHVDGTGLMLNAKMDLFEMPDFQPYIGAGLGAESIGVGGVAGMHGQSWRPALQVEAGISHPISDTISAFAEYRYTAAEDARISGGALEAHQHFSNDAVMAGLTYHFGP